MNVRFLHFGIFTSSGNAIWFTFLKTPHDGSTPRVIYHISVKRYLQLVTYEYVNLHTDFVTRFLTISCYQNWEILSSWNVIFHLSLKVHITGLTQWIYFSGNIFSKQVNLPKNFPFYSSGGLVCPPQEPRISIQIYYIFQNEFKCPILELSWFCGSYTNISKFLWCFHFFRNSRTKIAVSPCRQTHTLEISVLDALIDTVKYKIA